MELTCQDILRGRARLGDSACRPAGRGQGSARRCPHCHGRPKVMARVATDERVWSVLGRGVHAIRVDSQVLDPWFVVGAIAGAGGSARPGS